MCAAPGSKTAQLVEMLHIDEGMPGKEVYYIINRSNWSKPFIVFRGSCGGQ